MKDEDFIGGGNRRQLDEVVGLGGSRPNQVRAFDSICDRKIAAVRAALEHHFPAPDIDHMLHEIDRGRSTDLA